MTLYYNIAFLLISLFFFGCSSTSEITKNNDKLETIDTSDKSITTNKIELTVPYNWTEIKDNNNSIFEIWLINNEANAVISFIPINLNKELNLGDVSAKLNIIEELLISKKKSSGEDFSIIEQESFSSRYQMKTLKYLIDDQLQNSILFGEIFYECLSYFSKDYNPSEEEIDNLFEKQRQIVDELIIK